MRYYDDPSYASDDVKLSGSYHRWLPGASNLMIPCMIDCGCEISTDARYMKVSASDLFDLIIPDGLESSDSDLRADYCRKTRGLSQYISTGNTVIDQRKLKCALAVSVFDVKIGAFFQ